MEYNTGRQQDNEQVGIQIHRYDTPCSKPLLKALLEALVSQYSLGTSAAARTVYVLCARDMIAQV
jgi:hypothetical protein